MGEGVAPVGQRLTQELPQALSEHAHASQGIVG